MYYYNDFFPYHMFGFGSLFMIIFWGFVLYTLFSVFRHSTQTQKHTTNGKHALDILKERYAKGEITKEEFTSMKKDID